MATRVALGELVTMLGGLSVADKHQVEGDGGAWGGCASTSVQLPSRG